MTARENLVRAARYYLSQEANLPADPLSPRWDDYDLACANLRYAEACARGLGCIVDATLNQLGV